MEAKEPSLRFQSYVASANFQADIAVNAAQANNVTAVSNVVAVRVDGGAANNTATVRLFVDVNNDQAVQADELSATGTITFVAGTLNGGAFNAAGVPAGGTVAVVTADANAYVVSDITGDDTVLVTYGVRDQANQPLLTAANNVVFTVVNTGTTAITVQQADGTNFASGGNVAAGATATFTVATVDTDTDGNAAVDQDTASIRVISADSKLVNVSAQVQGNDATADSQPVVWTATVWAAAAQYNGTVVAFNKTNDWMLINTAVGNVLVNYAGAGITGYTVSNNTALVAAFETNLTNGDSVSISGAGVVALTNN